MVLTVIATGGTIDCVREDGVLKVGQTDLTPYIGAHDKISPFRILSEDITFGHYVRLIAAVKSVPRGGVLITHGSDTLPYTAAALAFCLADTTVPVVLTAADAPLNEPGNARKNLDAAMRVIDSGVPGVYVAYANAGEEADVYYGARMNEARDFDGAYTAPKGLYYARRGGKAVCGEPATGRPLAPVFADIAAYRFMPGVRPAVSDTPVLVMGTHSGTAASAELARLCAASDDVYLCGGTAGLTYESKAVMAGRVHFLDDIAWPAAYIKAALVYGAYDRPTARRKLFEPVVNESFSRFS